MKSDSVTHPRTINTGEQKKKMGRFSVNKSDILLLILSLFVPPICVWKRKGFFSRDFLLNLLLFVFFYIPAIIHAAYVIFETSQERYSDYEAIVNGVQQAEEPTNGDFNVDLEANGGELPEYDDIVRSSEDNEAGNNTTSSAMAAANSLDNKIQN